MFALHSYVYPFPSVWHVANEPPSLQRSPQSVVDVGEYSVAVAWPLSLQMTLWQVVHAVVHSVAVAWPLFNRLCGKSFTLLCTQLP